MAFDHWRRTSIRSHRPKLMPRFLVSAARYARAVRRRRQVSRFRSTPRVRRPMESRVLLGSDRLAALFASPVPVELPESTSSIPVRFTAETRKLRQCRFSLRSDRLATFLPLLPFRSNRPKAFRPSRVAPPGLPESRPGIASVPPGLTRRSTRASRVGRRGRARSSEESQQSRPPAAYEDPMPKHPLFACCFDALPFSPVARFDERRSAATHGHSTRRLPVHVRSSDAWSGRRAFALHSDAAALPSQPRNRLSSPCGSAPTQIFQHEYYFRLTGNNIGDPDRLMVQAFTYSKNISLSSLESRRHEQEKEREILHPSHLVSAGEPTNNFAFTSRYRVSENTHLEAIEHLNNPSW
jgi:hypothetical protein